MSYFPEYSEEEIPKQHIGERRWLVKHRHKGKSEMARQLRDRVTILKTLKDKDKTLSIKEKARLLSDCKDDMELNVPYSLNKKNRWETADPVELLKKASDAIDAAVVQRSVEISLMKIYLGADKATAAHTRVNNDGNGNFDIRTTKCIGPGQELSNFADESREKRTKKARRENDGGDEQTTSRAAIHYNIIEADRNPDLIVGHFYTGTGRRRRKNGGNLRNRGRNELAEELYLHRHSVSDNDADDYEYKDQASEDGHDGSSISLLDYLAEKKNKQRRRRRSASVDLAGYDIFGSKLTTFKELVDITTAIKSGRSFVNFKQNMAQNLNFDNEIEELKLDDMLEVRKIGQSSYSINALNAITCEGYPKAHLIIIVEELRSKYVSYTINSSVPGNSCTYPNDMYRLVCNSVGLREILDRLVKFFSANFQVHREINSVAMADNVQLRIKGYDPDELKNGVYNVPVGQSVPPPGNKSLLQSTVHESWLNSELLSPKGVAQNFPDMMQTVREMSYSEDEKLTDASCKKISNSSSAHECCYLCGYTGEHKLFLVKGGHLECSVCLQTDLLRQLRAGSLPLEPMLVLEEGVSSYDLLPAILPFPVFNLYTKIAFSRRMAGIGFTGKFIDCPNCQSLLYNKDPHNEEEVMSDPERMIRSSVGRSLSCGHCNHHWCNDCKDIPHWPMTCKQFSNWKPKWRAQCAIESVTGSQPLFIYRIRCSCDGEFHVSMPSSYASCPHCKLRIDPNSMEEIHQVTQRLYGRDRGRLICGNDWYITRKPYNPLQVQRIAIQPRIRKQVAKLCAEARQQRFDKKAYNMMLSKVRELKRDLPDSEKLPEAYKAALLLVENVNGWMYISKRTDDRVRRSLADVTKLRQKCVEVLSSDSIDNETLSKSIQLLEDGVHSTIRTIAERLKDVQDN